MPAAAQKSAGRDQGWLARASGTRAGGSLPAARSHQRSRAGVCVVSRWTGPESRSCWKITTTQTKLISLKMGLLISYSFAVFLAALSHITPTTRSCVWPLPWVNSCENPPPSSWRESDECQSQQMWEAGRKNFPFRPWLVVLQAYPPCGTTFPVAAVPR